MTRDEAAYSSKKYLQAALQAKSYQSSEEKNLAKLSAERSTNQKQLAAYSTEKVNLEKRLTNVQEIIRTLDTTVETAAAGANRSAGKAEERYAAAIRCSGVANASIQTVYRTKAVGDDNDTAATYQLCRNEETRLIEGIEALERQMANLENSIAALGKSISNVQSNIQIYKSQAQQYENTAAELARLAKP